MDGYTEQKIRERAYEIWLEAGMMPGLELEHWTMAERDVVAADRKPAAGASAAKPKATKPTASKSKAVKAKSPEAPSAENAKAKTAKAQPVLAKSPKHAKAAPLDARGTLN